MRCTRFYSISTDTVSAHLLIVLEQRSVAIAELWRLAALRQQLLTLTRPRRGDRGGGVCGDEYKPLCRHVTVGASQQIRQVSAFCTNLFLVTIFR